MKSLLINCLNNCPYLTRCKYYFELHLLLSKWLLPAMSILQSYSVTLSGFLFHVLGKKLHVMTGQLSVIGIVSTEQRYGDRIFFLLIGTKYIFQGVEVDNSFAKT
jgi:hypothetical protein